MTSSPQLSYYRPSGAAPLGGVAVTLAASVAGGVAMAAVYAFANQHNPVILLNVLLTLLFGFTLGWMVSKGVRVFRIRNAAAASAIGLIAFAAAYAAHWPVYISSLIVDHGEDVSPYNVALILRIALELVREPEEMWGLIKSVNESGVWSLSSGSHSRGSGIHFRGIFLAAIWAAEAAVICLAAVTVPWKEASKPYSERQNKWLVPNTLPARVAFIEDVEGLKNALARDDFSALTTPLPAGEANGAKYATVTLYPDAMEPYVSVHNLSTPDEKKGKSSRQTIKEVIQHLKISPTTAQKISNSLA
ncbi:MAG: hypothetical protein FWG71_07675 [Synergistaceae bacterium]|nr:hypothetical protein [Synergistaceae bacterium]